MKYIKTFEDVYYEPEPENFANWSKRVKDILEDFTKKYVEENMGLDLCYYWVEVLRWKMTISVGYNKEHKYKEHEGRKMKLPEGKTGKDLAKAEWAIMRDDMIDQINRELDMIFEPDHLSENGYMIDSKVTQWD